MRRVRLLVCFAAFMVAISSLRAETPNPSKLTVERIYASGDFHGESGPSYHWLDDAKATSLEAAASKKGRDVVRVDVATGNKEVLVAAEKLTPPGSEAPLGIRDYEFSNLDVLLVFTNSVRVWRQNTRGDYWIYRRSTDKLHKIGDDAAPSSLMFAKLSPDATQVGYVRENNIYVEPVDGGTATKLTSDGSAEVTNGTFDWVYEEEFFCRDGWRWSPDGKSIAYWQIDARGVKQFTLVDNTTGKYPELKSFAYPKTGEQNSACRIGVVPASGGSTRWIELPGDSRQHYIPRMEWAHNSEEILIERLNRLQNEDEILLANLTTGRLATVLTERDGAWLDVHDDCREWVEGGAALTWISERDGWRHLYLASRDGQSIRRVTSGDFDVMRVLRIDEKGGWVYFLASPDKPTVQFLYRSALSGRGPPERLTPANLTGWHNYDLSPEGKYAIHSWSSFETPTQSELVQLPEHKTVRSLVANEKLKATMAAAARGPHEFLRVDVGDGVTLDGWMIKPPEFEEGKKYPLLVYVYGEPAGQLVVDRWLGNTYLWHLMLAQQGYLVACFDNRGTPAPRGRDWRKAVYRKVGTLASEDQAGAARELLKRPYVDAARIGVWGWSGGGSMTLNLMFRYPDIYRTGMAVAPVPDMRLYDTIYQERYMGLPGENADDYAQGSPITHAAGLKGNLLIVHGTGDDNVHYQGTEKLVDVLIGLNKPFTMMAYPNRSHSIGEGKNTTVHLFNLLTRYLNEHMPPTKP